MKCLILAAGYATRLYPLCENFPKPLLEVGEKTIVDWLIDDLNSSNIIDEYIIVTNHKFVNCFKDFAKDKQYKITIIDDGSTANENRLGAILDIKFALDKLDLHEDILIIAGDNILDFSLNKFIDYFKEKNTSCTMRYFEKDKESLIHRGVMEVDGDRIINLTEKSPHPKSQWVCPPFYFFVKNDIEKLDEAIKDGCGVDAPGSFIGYLCKRSTMYALEMPGKRYDIGDLDSYKKICNEYKGIDKC